jgi:uncharacterized protein YdeI (YjbR/CyaY-like superfamily)
MVPGGLTEEIKWGKPCYSHQGKNIAIVVEQAGMEVGPAPELVLVSELQHRLDQDPALRAAFEALTPGRQREYHLYVSGAKQASTRAARVEKYVQKILDGKGFRDR